MNWNAWLKGLGLTLLGAAAGAAASTVNNKLQYGKAAPPLTGAAVGTNAAAGALVALVGYLVQSPIPAQPAPVAQPIEAQK